MKIINLSPNDFYTQTNNELKPFEACKPTARIMFYKGNKLNPSFPSSTRKLRQEEDKIFYLLNTESAKDWCKKRKYSLEVCKEPNLGNEVYPEYLDPLLFEGSIVSGFSYEMNLEEMAGRIATGEVLMTSGVFDYYSSKSNSVIIISHAIVLVGLTKSGFLIADPLNKDFHTNYRSGKGYLVEMTFDEARSKLKGEDTKKWCHYIK